MVKWTVIICQVTFSKLTVMSFNQTHPHHPILNIQDGEAKSPALTKQKKKKFELMKKNKEIISSWILLRNPWEKIGERAWALGQQHGDIMHASITSLAV